MKEHLINPPLPNSYQTRSREAIFKLGELFAAYIREASDVDTDKTIEVFNQVKEDLDVLTWKADKQVKALRDQVQWLKEVNRAE